MDSHCNIRQNRINLNTNVETICCQKKTEMETYILMKERNQRRLFTLWRLFDFLIRIITMIFWLSPDFSDDQNNWANFMYFIWHVLDLCSFIQQINSEHLVYASHVTGNTRMNIIQSCPQGNYTSVDREQTQKLINLISKRSFETTYEGRKGAKNIAIIFPRNGRLSYSQKAKG